MSETFQTAQVQRPANLAALRQTLMEMAANARSSAPKEKPVIVQGPVGEEVSGGICRARRLPRRCSISTSSAG